MSKELPCHHAHAAVGPLFNVEAEKPWVQLHTPVEFVHYREPMFTFHAN